MDSEELKNNTDYPPAPPKADLPRADTPKGEMNEELKNIIECFLFISAKPVTLKRISETLELKEEELVKLLEELRDEYENRKSGIKIREISGGWEFSTREEYGEFIKKFLKKEITFTLSPPALETLSIIAYKQPIIKQEVDRVRGVDASGAFSTLLKRKLIKVSGRKKTPGRPLLYSTTQDFLRYFK